MIFLALAAATACDGLFVAPAFPSDAVELRLAFEGLVGPAAEYGDLTPALAAVRRVAFRFVTARSVRDTIVAGRYDDGEIKVRVGLRPEEVMGWLDVRATLGGGPTEPLFQGRSIVDAYDVAPVVRMALEPVAHSLEILPAAPAFTAIGDTLALAALARFSTGYLIVGAVVAWSSRNPDIVEVLPDGRIVSRSNGMGTIEGAALGATSLVGVRVSQVPIQLTGVSPLDTTVATGRAFRARAFGEDRNGFPLLPGASLAWSATGSVAVDVNGSVSTLSPGVGEVRVTLGPVQHTITVNVIP